MSSGVDSAVVHLVREAMDVYADDPGASATLREYARRLDEPLRVAIAGMVKAGKSTLLNAVIGEEIAPTDAGECTRVVTWYRYADTPRVTLYPVAGVPRALPVKRIHGRLVFDLGGRSSDDVERLVVDWPARSLRDVTLIDTPGIASLSTEVSARSTTFLTPEDSPSEADAIVYLMRHLHASDLRFLESFRDTVAGRSGSVNAVAVLARADEVGGGRVDSLLSAREIAERYRQDASLRALALGVVPIAGLLAQSARSLRQSEFATLVELAGLPRPDRERMLISADRFIRPEANIAASSETRQALLARFGLFGIRLAAALVRGGISEPTALAHELARRSGLDELLRVINGQFQARAGHLKARTVLVGVEGLVRERPRAGAEKVLASLERIQSGAHEFQELRLLATVRRSGVDLPAAVVPELERLIGGQGVSPTRRLGLADDAPPEAIHAEARRVLHQWRTRAENPLAARSTADACQAVVRSCEALLAQDQGLAAPSPRARLRLAEPGTGAGKKADEHGNAREEHSGHQE